MESITQLTLNLQAPNYAATVYAVQNDRLSRKVAAQLCDGAVAFEPGYGPLAVVRYKKPDGTSGFYDADEDDNPAVTWTGSIATITLAEQMLTVPGDVYCQINFYTADDQRLTAFTFKIIVEESVIDDDTITSTDYFNILTQQIASILDVVTNMPAPATVLPEMDGTAAIGVRGEFARADHVHPKDTSKLDASAFVLATATPEMDGTGAVGTSSKVAKEDHVHPKDTTKADADDVGDVSDLSGFTATTVVGALNEIQTNLSNSTPITINVSEYMSDRAYSYAYRFGQIVYGMVYGTNINPSGITSLATGLPLTANNIVMVGSMLSGDVWSPIHCYISGGEVIARTTVPGGATVAIPFVYLIYTPPGS